MIKKGLNKKYEYYDVKPKNVLVYNKHTRKLIEFQRARRNYLYIFEENWHDNNKYYIGNFLSKINKEFQWDRG